MIDFERFWAQGDGGFEDDDDGLEGIVGEDRPGVDAREIRGWEKEHGVKLPEPLRTVLGLQNGGAVRNASLEILPLDQIAPVDEDFWEWTELDEEEAPDHDLMFVFGEETETGGTFLLNFNARGAQREPSVYIDHHGESTYLVNDTLSGFLSAMTASAENPSVNWSETEELPVVARELIDLSPLFGKPASLEQVLARQGEALALFTRERSPEGETLTRTTLPLPLDTDWAEINLRRPAPASTYGLHLQPEESDDIVEQRSETNDDGRWKNSTEHGAPIYVTFESTSLERLESLRKDLIGAKGAARAQAKQDQQAALEAKLDSLAPEQRTAAMLQAALRVQDAIVAEAGGKLGDTSGMPPQLAKAAEAMQAKLQQLMQLAQQKIAANPPDAETQRQIDAYVANLDFRAKE